MNIRLLDERRISKGWSQNEMAKRLGISKGYWSLLRAGKREAGPKVAKGLLRLHKDGIIKSKEASLFLAQVFTKGKQ